MPNDDLLKKQTEALKTQLEAHFTKRVEDNKTALQQNITLKYFFTKEEIKSHNQVLKSYKEMIEQEKIKLMALESKPEAFAAAVVEYLNKEFNLENRRKTPNDPVHKKSAVTEDEFNTLVRIQSTANELLTHRSNKSI